MASDHLVGLVMVARIGNGWIGLTALPLLVSARHRRLWAEMRAYVRDLPAALSAPLPDALRALTPAGADLTLPAAHLRRLADTAALVERQSPLGLCLRRSLVRYYFLRRAGLPLVLNFGARFKDGAADREVTGHAWVTLAGRPYHEAVENHRGFAIMLTYPDQGHER
jgi:hypothetical protein